MKRTTLVLAFLLTTGLVAGQTQLDEGPGWVTPDSALYGLETAWDNAGMAIGLKKAGTVAQERAAEARAMAEKNDTEAMQKAVDQMNRVAERAGEDDAEGLQKAASVIQEVMANAPEEAQQGIQTALDSIQQAQERIPGDIPAGSDAADQSSDQNASQRIAEARELREQGRQDLQQGNTALDNDNLQTARNEFGQAITRFREAINLIEDLDNAEADDLVSQLQTALQTAIDARDNVDEQMSGNQTQGGS